MDTGCDHIILSTEMLKTIKQHQEINHLVNLALEGNRTVEVGGARNFETREDRPFRIRCFTNSVCRLLSDTSDRSLSSIVSSVELTINY